MVRQLLQEASGDGRRATERELVRLERLQEGRTSPPRTLLSRRFDAVSEHRGQVRRDLRRGRHLELCCCSSLQRFEKVEGILSVNQLLI